MGRPRIFIPRFPDLPRDKNRGDDPHPIVNGQNIDVDAYEFASDAIVLEGELGDMLYCLRDIGTLRCETETPMPRSIWHVGSGSR